MKRIMNKEITAAILKKYPGLSEMDIDYEMTHEALQAQLEDDQKEHDGVLREIKEKIETKLLLNLWLGTEPSPGILIMNNKQWQALWKGILEEK